MRPTLDEINRLLDDAAEPLVEADRASEPVTATPIRVVNLRHEELGDAVYVGRVSPRHGLAESAFANPHRIGQDGDRAEVVAKYRSWLLGRQELLQRLHELRGRRLACWCSPEPCHADVLIELVDADAVLDDLAAAGVTVEAVDGRLRLSPPSAVDVALRTRVASLKPAILSLLATRPDAATLWRQAVEVVAESLKLPPDVLEAARMARVRWRPATGLKDR
jgi:hypothetical protein